MRIIPKPPRSSQPRRFQHQTLGTKLHRLDVPDLVTVLLNRTVGREESGTRDVDKRHPVPLLRVAIGGVHAVLRFRIGTEIRKEHVVVVVVEKVADDRIEEPRLQDRERVRPDHVQRRLDLGILLVVVLRDIGRTELRDLLGLETEEEHVVVADFLVDLDVCTVERAYRQRTVYHEFHASRAARFLSGKADLLGNIRRGHQKLRFAHVVVFDVDDSNFVPHRGVLRDLFTEAPDELYDALRHVVAARRLTSEDEGRRRNFGIRIILQFRIQREYLQHIEKLTLVLVHPLDLRVEHGVDVERDARLIEDMLREGEFVFGFYRTEPFEHRRVVAECGEIGEALGLVSVFGAYRLVKQR